jgi:hypothetical protein
MDHGAWTKQGLARAKDWPAAVRCGDPTLDDLCVAGPKFEQSFFTVFAGMSKSCRPSGDLAAKSQGLVVMRSECSQA